MIIVDEAGCLPFEQDAGNRFFQSVSSRYEHASLILTSNPPFSGWGNVFGDPAIAAAMTNRVVTPRRRAGPGRQLPATQPRGIDTLPEQNARRGRVEADGPVASFSSVASA